jgi:hypothetical protein
MSSTRLAQRIALLVGAAAVMGSGALAACSSEKKDEKPAERPAGEAPAVVPTEKKSLGSFTPTVKAPPAPTALPGNVVTGG